MANEDDEAFDLDAWYESGKPIFTKEAMRHLSSQLRNPHRRDDEAISNLTVWGKISRCNEAETWVEDGDEPGEEYAWTPQCSYNSIEHLQQMVRDKVITDHLCGVSMSHIRGTRSKATKARILNSPDVSEEMSAKQFQQMLDEWRESEVWTAMERVLRANFPHRVTELIAFAAGRFSMVRDEDDAEDQPHQGQRCIVQHCISLLLREVLRDLKLSDKETACYAQDPDYSDVDIAVLQRNDIKVLEDPDGFLTADSASCVLSFSPNVPVRQVIIDVARPALLIWDSIDKGDFLADVPGHQLTDPVSSRVEKVLQEEYHSYALPDDDHFSPLVMYIRRAK